jgi:hypothetical protein
MDSGCLHLAGVESIMGGCGRGRCAVLLSTAMVSLYRPNPVTCNRKGLKRQKLGSNRVGRASVRSSILHGGAWRQKGKEVRGHSTGGWSRSSVVSKWARREKEGTRRLRNWGTNSPAAGAAAESAPLPGRAV